MEVYSKYTNMVRGHPTLLLNSEQMIIRWQINKMRGKKIIMGKSSCNQ